MKKPYQIADRERDVFGVCRDDLNRLSRWIRRTGVGQPLTVLARRFTRGRLRYGPMANAVLLPASLVPERVRYWDPAKAWLPGDAAIFAVPVARQRERSVVPCYGEVERVQGHGVVVRIDGQPGTQVHGMASKRQSEDAVAQWRRSVEAIAEAASRRTDEDSRVDYALWTHGEEIFGNLLAALRNVTRFILMDGRWFVKSLAVRPTRVQLDGLAQRMLYDNVSPLTVEEMMLLLPPPELPGEPGLFGLALALMERPDLFVNVSGGTMHARWTLGRPPQGSYAAKLAAYDPETWEVLCEPGDELAWETVERLWSLELLQTVIARQERSG